MVDLFGTPAKQEVVDDPDGNKMLLVMDYMEGGPVLTREGLERGRRIPEPLALQYFRDMCKVRRGSTYQVIVRLLLGELQSLQVQYNTHFSKTASTMPQWATMVCHQQRVCMCQATHAKMALL